MSPCGVSQKFVMPKVVRAMRELQPQVIITFGADGLYGHDDHIAIGELTTKACAAAAQLDAFPQHFEEGLALHHTTKFYYAACPKGLMTALVERLQLAGLPSNLWDISASEFGIPGEAITTEIDVRDFVDRKLAALRCHQTQMMDDHAFKSIPLEIGTEFLSVEHFYLVSEISPSRLEVDLFADT